MIEGNIIRSGLLAASLFFTCTAFSQNNWKQELHTYIDTKLKKADGGYGWDDQYDSHTSASYAVTGILFDIGELPAGKAQLAEFIRTHHPQKGPNREAGPSGTQQRNLVYQQIQAIQWLGADVSSFSKEVLSWKSQKGMLANYEEHGYPALMQESMTPICRALLGLPASENEQDFEKYLKTNRRTNGSYNNAPATEGGDGNILNTYWALAALKAVNAGITEKEKTIEWLQSCQLKSGGFTHQPHPGIGINDEAIYTWAAIKALNILGAKPKDTEGAIRYLASLRNDDGGFGNRPGIPSNPLSSFYAVDAMKELNGFPAFAKTPAHHLQQKAENFSGYHIYTVQFEGSGIGSPEEAVMLADSLNINLWGVKNAVPGWIEKATAIAAERKVPVKFFISNESYKKNLVIPGMGEFGHILDYITPVTTNVSFPDSSTFNEFRNTSLKELSKVNGALILQVSHNEPMARMLLDESVNRGFYVAISTIHFGQNFSFWLSYLNEYRHQVPFITLQDAHGIESWWWSNELVNHRTLFVAKEPTYDALMDALHQNRIVAVRHDSISDYKTRMQGGTAATRKFINEHTNTWKWWNDKEETVRRPWAAITMVRPQDSLEVGRKEGKTMVRVRCWWNSIRQALQSAEITLETLKVDNKTVAPEYVEKKSDRSGISDAYYLYEMDNAQKGTHTIEATVKNKETNEVRTIKKSVTL